MPNRQSGINRRHGGKFPRLSYAWPCTQEAADCVFVQFCKRFGSGCSPFGPPFIITHDLHPHDECPTEHVKLDKSSSLAWRCTFAGNHSRIPWSSTMVFGDYLKSLIECWQNVFLLLDSLVRLVHCVFWATCRGVASNVLEGTTFSYFRVEVKVKVLICQLILPGMVYWYLPWMQSVYYTAVVQFQFPSSLCFLHGGFYSMFCLATWFKYLQLKLLSQVGIS